MKKYLVFTMSFILLFVCRGAFGDEANEIIKKSQGIFYYAGNDYKAKVVMKLIGKEGKERVREMTMLRKNYGEIGGAQKFFIYFTEPADVKNMTFMVYKYADKDADRWLFVPALNMVKRIAAQDKTSSFVGSDFTYEDVSGRNIKDDKHELLKEESIDGKQCYMVKSTPIEKTSSYSYKLSWIDKKTLLPVKEEYHDLQGETARVFSADKIEDINGFPTITGRTMKNIQTGHRTEVTFLDTKYNVGIDDNLFSERYLSQPPAKWVK